uniref:Integrase catalytic domain-containing protein n=1 Tax=Panagrellus redivivus TaxID=6233 RepID=A0A7E4USB0_PANRE
MWWSAVRTLLLLATKDHTVPFGAVLRWDMETFSKYRSKRGYKSRYGYRVASNNVFSLKIYFIDCICRIHIFYPRQPSRRSLHAQHFNARRLLPLLSYVVGSVPSRLTMVNSTDESGSPTAVDITDNDPQQRQQQGQKRSVDSRVSKKQRRKAASAKANAAKATKQSNVVVEQQVKLDQRNAILAKAREAKANKATKSKPTKRPCSDNVAECTNSVAFEPEELLFELEVALEHAFTQATSNNDDDISSKRRRLDAQSEPESTSTHNEVQAESAELEQKFQEIKGQLQQARDSLKEFRIAEKNLLQKLRPQARLPFSQLSKSGRAKAAKKLMSHLQKFCPNYMESDWIAIFAYIFPAIKHHQQLTAVQTLQLQIETHSSQRTMDKIRSVLFNLGIQFLASKRVVNELRLLFALSVSHVVMYNGKKPVPNAYVTDVVGTLQRRLEAQIRQGNFRASDSVAYCLVIDKGSTTTKCGILCSSLDNRNAPSAMLLAAIYEGDEDRELMRQAFGPVIAALETFDSVTVDGVVYPVVRFFTGDLKCCKCFLGIKASTCRRPCPWCNAVNDFVFGLLEPHGMDGEGRDFDTVDASMSQEDVPLMKFDSSHIVLPCLHLFMGVAARVIDFTLNGLCSLEHRLKKKAAAKLAAAEGGENNEDDEVDSPEADSLCNDEDSPEADGLCNDEDSPEADGPCNDEDSPEAGSLHNDAVPPEADGLHNEEDPAEAEHRLIELALDGIERLEFNEKQAAAILKNETYSTETATNLSCASKKCIFNAFGEFLERSNRQDRVTHPTTQKTHHTLCLGLSAKHSAKLPAKYKYADPTRQKVLSAVIEERKLASKNHTKALKKLNTAHNKLLAKTKAVDNSEYCEVFFDVLSKFGADRKAWHQRFNGAHTRRILSNANKIPSKLVAIIDGVETRLTELDPTVADGVKALQLLGEVQEFTRAKKLSRDEIVNLSKKVEVLRYHFRNSTLSTLLVGHKAHVILNHMVPMAEKWTTVNYFSEQAIEAAHAEVNRQSARILTRDVQKRLTMIIQWSFEINMVKDEYGTIASKSNEKRSAPDREIIGSTTDVPEFFALEQSLNDD